MKTACRFAYIQARVQARFAALPTDEEWQRLAAARTLASFLEEARAGGLRAWIKPLSGQSDAHDVEIGLRAIYREQVAQLAAWLPAPWRAAMLWTRWLALIPLFEHLARGGAMPAWVTRDHDLQPLLDDGGNLSPERLRVAGAGPLLAPGVDPAAVWLTQWRLRWPPCKRAFLRNLESLHTLLANHLTAFRVARPEAAWGLRKVLHGRLGLLFHRHLLQPAGPFTYLALAALDLERLRAELVVRALFAPRDTA